jgi:transposase-like protein
MNNRQPIHPHDIKRNIRPDVEATIGLSQGPGPLSDLPGERPLWGNEALLATIPSPPYTDAIKAEILRLLRLGQPVAQVAAILRVPSSLVYRLRSQFKKDSPLEEGTSLTVDGRCLYDSDFKQEAIRQIKLGIPVRKIAQALGVSTITLHKWKKADLSETSAAENLSLDPIDVLRNQLREALEELDVLKKALIILLRP